MATTKPIAKAKVNTPTESKATATKVSTEDFVFQKINYQLMVVGIVVIIVGFLLYLGVNNDDPSVFPAEEIYSFRRITLAPIVVLTGFGIEIFAILKRAKV
jgi:hypothetical protein